MIVAADGQGYVDDAVEGIGEDGVYVSSEVPDAAALEDQLEAQIGDESIGVAVFSDNAALEASGVPRSSRSSPRPTPSARRSSSPSATTCRRGRGCWARARRCGSRTRRRDVCADVDDALTQTIAAA